jgi:cytosine/adenosine deaminase-related metal-dependent hydrolase
MPDWNRVEVLLAELAEQDVAILTTGAPSREVPSVKRVRGAGLRMGAGCDGVIDTWNPWNRPDMLDRARIVAQKNNFRADADLALVLDLVTTGGAAVMGVADHRLAVGCRADLALIPGRTLAEAVAQGGPVHLTVKGGHVTGRNGASLMVAP